MMETFWKNQVAGKKVRIIVGFIRPPTERIGRFCKGGSLSALMNV